VVSSHDSVRSQLRILWLTALNRPSSEAVEGNDNFFESGGTSLGVVKLYSGIAASITANVDLMRTLDVLEDGSFSTLVEMVAESVEVSR
jgi:hypothetical protein